MSYKFSAPFTLFVIFYLCISLLSVHSLRFHIKSGKKKCLKEEIHKDVLVTGAYEISDAPGEKAHIQVSDTKGHILYQKDSISKGKFAFTTEEYDMFDVCFETKAQHGGHTVDREVSLVMKHGVEAKNYDELAKAEKLKPLEAELKRLEDLAQSVVSDFAYMRAREEEMRDTNESTHSRVFYFSIFSMLCLLALATWQVFYLRRYFKAKKLIE